MKYTRPAFIVLMFLLLRTQPGTSQTVVQFMPMAGGLPLVLDHAILPAGTKDSLRISTLRCYVSNVALLSGQQVVWSEKSSYHLLDAGEDQLTIALAVPAGTVYDGLRFDLGIDSATNAAGAQGGALDATKGMYWAWQSGYINLKLEGSSPACTTRKSAFSFHLGGFTNGNYCLQRIRLDIRPGKLIRVGMDLDRFFRAVDLAQLNTVMSPGADAVRLSALFAATCYNAAR